MNNSQLQMLSAELKSLLEKYDIQAYSVTLLLIQSATEAQLSRMTLVENPERNGWPSPRAAYALAQGLVMNAVSALVQYNGLDAHAALGALTATAGDALEADEQDERQVDELVDSAEALRLFSPAIEA